MYLKNTLKSITNNTSNYHPGHIIGNIMIRLQAREQIGGDKSVTSQSEKRESKVSKLATLLPKFPNTKVRYSTMKNFASLWQAHLEKLVTSFHQREIFGRLNMMTILSSMMLRTIWKKDLKDLRSIISGHQTSRKRKHTFMNAGNSA